MQRRNGYGALGPRVETGHHVCSWCKATMDRATPCKPGRIANYGICRRCLALNLRRLDVLRPAARMGLPTPG